MHAWFYGTKDKRRSLHYPMRKGTGEGRMKKDAEDIVIPKTCNPILFPFPMLLPVPGQMQKCTSPSTQIRKAPSILVPFPNPSVIIFPSRPGNKDVNDTSPGHSSSVSVPRSRHFVPSSLLVSLVQPCPLTWVALRLCSCLSLDSMIHAWHPRHRSTVDDPCTRQRSRPPTWLPSVNGGCEGARWRGMRRCRSREQCLEGVRMAKILCLKKKRGAWE